MPRVTIWIRQEDWDKWQAIDNKPEWLHERLSIKHDLETGYKAIQAQRQVDQIINEPTVEPLEEGA